MKLGEKNKKQKKKKEERKKELTENPICISSAANGGDKRSKSSVITHFSVNPHEISIKKKKREIRDLLGRKLNVWDILKLRVTDEYYIQMG